MSGYRQSTPAFPGAASSTWFLWQDGQRPPGLNMAIDETLLTRAGELNRPLLRFYGWDRPSISIGYTQKFKLTEHPGFALVRRPTGGGVVFHDHDFTYTVVIPSDHLIAGMDRYESYRIINTAVRAGLERADIVAALADREIPGTTDRAAMVCFTNPTRYDLLANGRKIAGSAQRRTGSGILHQGSLHFGQELPLPRTSLASAMIDGFKATLSIDFIDFTSEKIMVTAAQNLAASRYDLDDWNHKR